MPGDNVEMVCDLHFDVAAEVGSRYAFPFSQETCLVLYNTGSLSVKVVGPVSTPFNCILSRLIIVLYSRNWYHYPDSGHRLMYLRLIYLRKLIVFIPHPHSLKYMSKVDS